MRGAEGTLQVVPESEPSLQGLPGTVPTGPSSPESEFERSQQNE